MGDYFILIPIVVTTISCLVLLVLVLLAYIITNKPFTVISLNNDAITFIDELQSEFYEEDYDIKDN